MLITLVGIEDEESLRRALRCAAGDTGGREPQKRPPYVYATPHPALAAKLAGCGLPCIYAAETDGAAVCGVDLVICGKEEGWRSDPAFLERVWRRHYGLPWTIAETERLCVRESVMEDLPALLAMYGQERENPDVTPFSEQPEEELSSYIRNRYPFFGYGLWSVVEKESGRLIGRAGFEEREAPGRTAKDGAGRVLPELSYMTEKESRGRGYAREAARAALRYGKEELGFREVLLRASPENTASVRLAAGLGFHPVAGAQNFYKIDLTSCFM